MLARSLLLGAIFLLPGLALAAESSTAPAPVANGSRPLAGSEAPGRAATKAVTDPSAVPPSERAPGAGPKPIRPDGTPSDAKR